MSKASNNTTSATHKSLTRRDSANETTLAKMRAIAAKLPALRAAFIAANKRYSEVEEALFGALPRRPDHSRDMPLDVREAFNALTFAQLAVLPDDHPYSVWQRQCGGAERAERAKYRAECDRIKATFPGYKEAIEENRVTSERLCRAADRVLSIKATGLEAIALKIVALRSTDFEKGCDDINNDLLACIDATAAASGFNTKI